MVISELLSKSAKMLSDNGNDNPRFEAMHIICFVLKMPPKDFILGSSAQVSKDDETEVLKLIKKRISGVPFQHILGTQEFMSLEFSVSPDVLIPRQDTEALVEFLLDRTGSLSLSVLDIGTGSGCIPISLAHFKSNLTCKGIDISENALNLAEKNAEILGVSDRVLFEKCDILTDFPKGKYDIITSNPPYIKSDIIPTLQKEVRDFEPHLALDGGKDGLTFYRRIVEIAPKILNKGGLLAFEIGFDQAEEVTSLMKKDFENIETVKDLLKNDRVVAGFLKKER